MLIRKLTLSGWMVSLILAVTLGKAIATEECLRCHSAPGLKGKTATGEVISLHVDPLTYRNSVHAKKGCRGCHTDVKTYPHQVKAKQVDCAHCHFWGNKEGAPQFSPMKDYADSVHGRALLERHDPDAPNCKDCHGAHDVTAPTAPESPVHRTNIAKTCGRCHADERIVREHHIPQPQPVKAYERGVHGQSLLKAGLTVVAVCTDCHGIHGIRAARDPQSKVNRPHIPETCAQCHEGIYREYKDSIHGRAVAAGVSQSPVCTDCHGEHSIYPPQDPESPVYPLHVPETCSKCHEDAGIRKEFGLPAHRLSSYIESYHGVANRHGDITVANCATCHGVHNIRPSSDLASTVHPSNIPRTCGRCHPGASENFARGSVHVLPSKGKDVGVYYVRRFYTWFILSLVGGFAGYIFLDLFSRARRRGWRKLR